MKSNQQAAASPADSGAEVSQPFPAILPATNLEKVEAWGGASRGVSHVYRPTTVDDLKHLFQLARATGSHIGFRGGGKSYGDAAMNDENILIDMRRMNRILAWDPKSGLITLEPGVTLAQLWQYTLEDGWWPPVVTGTMATTIGGCAGMNVHGKNGWQVGPIGDHITRFELLLASGELVGCDRKNNSDLFHAAIGGFGALGCFTSVTMQMKPVYSGLLEVQTESRANLDEMFSYFEENLESSDYIVGWIDAFASGESLGRGDVHSANYLPQGADPFPTQTMRLENQHLPDTMFGLVPKSIIWMFMRPFMNNLGTRLVNTAKYRAGRLSGPKVSRQPHAAFHFLLDYVPNWKQAYGRGGLIQYQPFIPKENAQDAFAEILKLCQQRGLPNYLTVLKRHRPDDFLLTHGMDGYSMAMDFRLNKRNRNRVASLAKELDQIVLAAGGRFYFAKDSTLDRETTALYLGKDTVEKFRALKSQYDPDNLLQSNLWRRLFS